MDDPECEDENENEGESSDAEKKRKKKKKKKKKIDNTPLSTFITASGSRVMNSNRIFHGICVGVNVYSLSWNSPVGLSHASVVMTAW